MNRDRSQIEASQDLTGPAAAETVRGASASAGDESPAGPSSPAGAPGREPLVWRRAGGCASTATGGVVMRWRDCFALAVVAVALLGCGHVPLDSPAALPPGAALVIERDGTVWSVEPAHVEWTRCAVCRFAYPLDAIEAGGRCWVCCAIEALELQAREPLVLP